VYATYMQTLVKIGAVVIELSCGQTDKQETNRQTDKRQAKYNQ